MVQVGEAHVLFDRGFYYVENTCAMDFYVTDFRVCDPMNIVHKKCLGFINGFVRISLVVK